MKEIERKFLVSQLSASANSDGQREERCFLYIDEDSEIRVQHHGNDRFTLQNKSHDDAFQDNKQTISISAQQFESLKTPGRDSIERTNYILPDIPRATVKVYCKKV